ncbi:MAG: hydrogenase 4 subunit F [Peptostreptococcaceae bacterium]|nr:hydrogenase 4 subunit F [Peptostreptococcaceae bacterium]
MIICYLISAAAILIFISCSRKINLISYMTTLSLFFLVAAALKLYPLMKNNGVYSLMNGMIVVDSLNYIQLVLISTVSLIVSLYSRGYINHEIEEKKIDAFYAKIYYFLFNLFILSMLVVVLSANILLMWMGLEATTLSTAFLIGFNRHELSLEAAWKYIIICSVGIALGLIGIIFFLFSIENASYAMINWNYLAMNPDIVNPDIAKYAFAFVFIGIATKAGLAPMHTWLPDAHSESPSPISAMMSGVLLNLALYYIIRFHMILKNVPGLENSRQLFMIFGFISLFVSSFSILKQKNYKRLLAFSSVENMGIIAIGIGIGSNLAIYGAILHSIIHAFGKTLLFLVSGNILNVYGTKRIEKVRNLIKVMPINALMLILGVLVITGVPPFASFISEYSILISMISGGNYFLAGAYLFCLLIVFAGFINVFIRMVFESGDIPAERSGMDKKNLVPLIATLTVIFYISLSQSQINPIINNVLNLIN